MTWGRGSLLGILVWVAAASPAFASQPGKCNTISEGSSSTVLSTVPARVCHIEFIATGSNGWAQFYDSDITSETSPTVSEPSAATSGNHAEVNLGPEGHVTDKGLGVKIVNGRYIIKWGK